MAYCIPLIEDRETLQSRGQSAGGLLGRPAARGAFLEPAKGRRSRRRRKATCGSRSTSCSGRKGEVAPCANGVGRPWKRSRCCPASPLFEMLSNQELEYVAELSRRAASPPGRSVFEEGELGDSLYVIVRGEVEVLRARRGGAPRGHRRAHRPGLLRGDEPHRQGVPLRHGAGAHARRSCCSSPPRT